MDKHAPADKEKLRIVLDTNFLMIPGQFKIDIFEEIRRIVSVIVSMGKDQQRMDEFYNTLLAIKSTHGSLPSWRIYRNGSVIEPCRPGINGNCDTASDADARIIIALFTASKNPYFTDNVRKQQYYALAKTMSADFLKHEIVNKCYPSSQGSGSICYWLAAGSDSKTAGISSSDFAYTGYYPDAIIAMLAACSQTQNSTYCSVAGNLTLNYLEASRFDDGEFSVPPGKSFRWQVNQSTGIPYAQCTNTCNPVSWDDADAPRAVAICSALHYSRMMNHTLPDRLDDYCRVWNKAYMSNPAKAPLQYYQNGSPSASYQNGYFAQGLQSLMHLGCENPSLYEQTLDSALSHYVPATRTWDYTPAFGVYGQSFAIRSLGTAIGRDEKAFSPVRLNMSTTTTSKLSTFKISCTYSTISCPKYSDVLFGSCRTVTFNNSSGNIRMQACEKSKGYIEIYI